VSAVFGILLKAALSVRAAGRQEIGLDDLLDAFEHSVSANAPELPDVGEVFVPIPHQDVPRRQYIEGKPTLSHEK